LKKVFVASYKSFYFSIIGVLWVLAVIFALIQSGFIIEFTLKNILPKYGVTVGGSSGGILSGLELRDVKYDKLLSASEVRFRLGLPELLNGEISLYSVDIKNLKVDEKELTKLLDKKTAQTKQEFLKVVKIEKLSLTLIDFSYKDIKLSNLKLNSDYLFYDFSKFYMDMKAEVSSNILNAKFNGDILDKNYSMRGILTSNGSQYINKIVDDVDFDFNAIKDTDFLIRGDDASLYAKAHIKNSGAIYKYNVDAKINDAISEANIDFKQSHLKVTTQGEIDSRYGVLDSKFDVIYDGNKTTYQGKARVKKFKYIPLGVFAKGIKIKEAINEEATFSGDVHKVEIKTKNSITATLLDERFDVPSSETVVEYDIDKEFLRVKTKAFLQTDYFGANIENTVEDNGKVSFSGKVSNFENIALGIDNKTLHGASAEYIGDEDILSVNLKAPAGNIRVSSNGYSKYDFVGTLKEIHPSKDGRLSFLTDSRLGAKIKGSYEYKSEEIIANIVPFDTLLFGKKLEAKEIAFKKTPHSLSIPKTQINLGGVGIQITASTHDGKMNALLKTDGVQIKADGVLNKEVNLQVHGDTGVLSSEYAKITDTKKQNISGAFSLNSKIIGEGKQREIHLSANSDLILFAGEELKNLALDAHLDNTKIKVKKLQTTYQNTPYQLTREATVYLEDGKATCENLQINDTLFANFEYKNNRLTANAKVKNFAYKDNNKLSFILNAKLGLLYENKKLDIAGDALLRDLRAGFELKSSKITKDKDIIILRAKKLEFNEQKFIDNLALRINISNENVAIYKSKEAYAPIDLNLVYYKDYGAKPSLVGLIKTNSGYYELEGRRFVIQNGQIALAQIEPNNPYLDLTLKYTDKEAEIYIYVREFSSAPKISFSSKPAMSEREIISYLLFGVDPDSGFTKTTNDARYSSKAIAALSNALSRDLTKEFGIKLDKVEISPTEVTDKTGRTTQTTKVEIGKKITKDLSVTYKNDIESSVVFEYQINKNVNIESQAGRKSSIDIFYKKDY
jgi:translocation and assembly module TamB